MAFPIIAAVAAQQGADILGNAISMHMQDKFNRRNMAIQQQYAVDNQINAPLRYSAGLQKAGLPVNLALNGAFQTTGSPSSSNPTPHSAPVDVSALVLSNAQSRLLESEAEGKEIENNLKEIELNNKISENSTINANMRNYYAQRAINDPDNAEFWKSRSEAINDYDVGSLSGQSRFDDEIVKADTRRLQLLDNAVLSKVKESQLKDEGVIKALVKSPHDTRVKIYQDIAKSKGDLTRIVSQNLKDQSDIDKANIEAKKILSDIDHAYNSDLVANVRNGDYVGALLILGSTIAKEASAGAGAAAVGAATRNPAGAVAGYRNARARAPERAQGFPR